MNAVFAADLAAILLGPLAVAASYTPAGGTASEIRVLPVMDDRLQNFNGGSYLAERAVFLVAVADVAAPAAGDTIAISGLGTFTVQGQPLRDERRLRWSIEARPS